MMLAMVATLRRKVRGEVVRVKGGSGSCGLKAWRQSCQWWPAAIGSGQQRPAGGAAGASRREPVSAPCFERHASSAMRRAPCFACRHDAPRFERGAISRRHAARGRSTQRDSAEPKVPELPAAGAGAVTALGRIRVTTSSANDRRGTRRHAVSVQV
jgi:hypothetical protein